MSSQKEQRCPVCGKIYTEHLAVSRKDSETNICQECGMREAIEAMVQSRRTVQGGMTLLEAIDTLDGVIPPPDNRMVDLDHLPTAMAWQRIKASLPPLSELEGLTYRDIQPEINEVCKAHPGCWHTPAAEVDCPYVDVCREKYYGPDNGNAAFEAAVVGRYKELKAGTRYGISILPEDCQAYTDGYRYGAYKQIVKGETHIVEFFKSKEEILAFVNEHPLYRSKKGRDSK
ncbi:MAG: hypothetical protein K2O18_13600 [Oscillospiraceae bacterium]|nr:hypothetical protein [Oscillospiraceae bacterium]